MKELDSFVYQSLNQKGNIPNKFDNSELKDMTTECVVTLEVSGLFLVYTFVFSYITLLAPSVVNLSNSLTEHHRK